MRTVLQIGLRCSCLLGLLISQVALADDAPAPPDAPALPDRHAPELPPKKWLVLHVPEKPSRNVQPLTDKSKLVPLEVFALTGPEPGHPFVLGDFQADGKWGVVEGGIQVIGGKNAVLELARGDQFELEGRMEQTNLGGWFLLVGWNDGHGYCLSNFVTKESGAPWFLTEFRGGKALNDTHVQLPDFEWQRDQPFKLQILNKALTLDVGPKRALEQQELPNYEPGAVILGTYETRYGARAVRLNTLRGRALEPVVEK